MTHSSIHEIRECLEWEDTTVAYYPSNGGVVLLTKRKQNCLFFIDSRDLGAYGDEETAIQRGTPILKAMLSTMNTALSRGRDQGREEKVREIRRTLGL